MAFSPDGKTLASVSGDGGIQLWDIASGAKLGDGVGHGLLMTVAFSADGRTVAAGAMEGSISVWDFTDRQLRERGQPLIGDGSAVWGIVFAPDSQTLASRSTYSIIFRNLSDTQPQPLRGPLTGCSASGSSLAFSPDGKALASGGVDGGIILWDLVGHKCVALVGGVHESLTTLAFSPDGTRLASSGGGKLKLWDTFTRRQSGEVFTENVTGIAFSPDGLTLAGSRCSTRDTSASGMHRGSPCTKGEILLWDVRTHKVRGHVPTGEESADRITFSPNGKMLASITGRSVVMLWDVAASRAAGPPLSSMEGNVMAISFSPDGRTLAAQKYDRGIELWDVTSHRTYDDSILTWNQVSRAPLGEGPTAEITVDESAFSPDLKTVASAARKTLLLQDVSTKQQLGPPLDGQLGDITSLAFSPDGKAVASGAEQQILLWDLSPESWQARACRVASRNLSQREWNDHFGRQPYRKTCGDLPIHPSAFQHMVDREEAALTAGDSVALALARREVAEATAELDDAELLNLICWNEAMKGFGGIVLPLCERAVALAPETADYRDSRALARALAGDYRGAVEDFSFYLKSGTDEDLRKQRETWIAELKQGRNPFNALSLRELRVFSLGKRGVTVGARKH